MAPGEGSGGAGLGAEARGTVEVEVGGLGGAADDAQLHFQFHHIHTYVDSLKPLQEYKDLEDRLNKLAHRGHYDPFSGGMRYLEPKSHHSRVLEGKGEWLAICAGKHAGAEPEAYSSAGQDFVEQLILGLGWRVAAEYNGVGTRSVLVTSSDACGVKFVISAPISSGGSSEASGSGAPDEEPYDHFRREHLDRFMQAHGGRQGISVLGFEVGTGECAKILDKYGAKHPKLLVTEHVQSYADTRTVRGAGKDGLQRETTIELGALRIVEAFAYYQADGEADHGTVLRFVERSGTFASQPGFSNPCGVLPGLVDVNPQFDGTTIPAYSDHWVSNVIDREGFLQTLRDTLGFAPKVDFNAGVVAAGDAIIESTVVGNTSDSAIFNKMDALRNQTQVYLPVNNALSDHGHVHGFLKELGQGVQHVASRVDDLVSFVERVNNYRTMTGGGFSFLNIPRSYYGVLMQKDLVAEGVEEELAGCVIKGLAAAGLCSVTGVVDLDVSAEKIAEIEIPNGSQEEFQRQLPKISFVTLRSRYSNLYSLLGTLLSEAAYLQIVRNKILVDIQGEDILYQIFTCNILQRAPGEQAPFLEFIQRVCKECHDDVCDRPIKPGCGGFGIRNFLTLFLSIEVSKAMSDQQDALAAGDAARADRAAQRTTLLTRQLEESNPILTEISDAMTAEGLALDALGGGGGGEAREKWVRDAEAARGRKEEATQRLQALSKLYAEEMQRL